MKCYLSSTGFPELVLKTFKQPKCLEAQPIRIEAVTAQSLTPLPKPQVSVAAGAWGGPWGGALVATAEEWDAAEALGGGLISLNDVEILQHFHN